MLQCVRYVVDFSQAQLYNLEYRDTADGCYSNYAGTEHDCERRCRLLSRDENVEWYVESGRIILNRIHFKLYFAIGILFNLSV